MPIRTVRGRRLKYSADSIKGETDMFLYSVAFNRLAAVTKSLKDFDNSHEKFAPRRNNLLELSLLFK